MKMRRKFGQREMHTALNGLSMNGIPTGHQVEMFRKKKYELKIWKFVGAGDSDLIAIIHGNGQAPPRKKYRMKQRCLQQNSEITSL